MTPPRTGNALFNAGGVALAVFAFALFLLAARLAVRPLRRLEWNARVPFPRCLGCVVAGAGWIVLVISLYAGLLLHPPLQQLPAACLAPGVVAVSLLLERAGVNTLMYGTQVLIVGLLLDVVIYALCCYVLSLAGGLVLK